MQNIFDKIRIVWEDKNLRNRILFVLGALVIFRLLAAIPIPGIDAAKLSQFLSNNQFFGILNIFSGGGLSNLSIIMLGVGPYITSSIIMQLLTIMVPRLKALYHEEGDLGKQKFTQYSRILTVPLAFLQGFGLMMLLQKQGILQSLGLFSMLSNLLVIVAGSLLLMWIGELISEYGVSNGVSLLIFAGIVASLPTNISQLLFTFDVSQVPLYIALFVGSILIVAGIVFITEAERPIPVTYAKRVRGMKVYGGVSTYIPLRLNQAGVIPIIFALSILLFPQMIATFLAGVNSAVLQNIGAALSSFVQNQWFYGITYFILVILFTYFYTAVTFDPKSMSENLQKNGAFIPGIRPGEPTAEYVSKILTRITLVGAIFLGFVAVLPLIVQGMTGMANLAIGGTALLIVVSVVIDLIKKIDAQISMREY
ncbi:MAG TPA: preprotein translocase subunit SecY [Candidatus Paceibacterota bacterium]